MVITVRIVILPTTIKIDIDVKEHGPACQQKPVCNYEEKINCSNCNRWFRNNQCFNNHKKENICETVKRCEKCLKIVKTNREHVCGEIFCKICKKFVPNDHLCYMGTVKPYKENGSTLFVFYGLECRQDEKLYDESYRHTPNLCIFNQCCSNCINDKNLFFCQTCGFRQKILRGNVISDFMQYLLTVRKKFKNVIVIAHNGQSYDHQFILNHILTKTYLTPEVIMRGTKIISLCLVNIKFLDSLNYFPMALSKLPKTFGLGDDFKKGYFPHLFNTVQNENYIGPLPDISYYGR